MNSGFLLLSLPRLRRASSSSLSSSSSALFFLSLFTQKSGSVAQVSRSLLPFSASSRVTLLRRRRMEEVFGLHHRRRDHCQLYPVDLHDQFVTARGDDLQSHVVRMPGYAPSSYSGSAVRAPSEASSMVAGGGRGAAAGFTVGGGGQVMTPGEEAVSSTGAIKTKIASHPLYPRLLEAYIDCQKVGAPPEVASLLNEIGRANDIRRSADSGFLGADPELDHFMATYCDLLVKYKTDIARPFDEATTFLNSIEVQLGNLCKDSSCLGSDAAARSLEEYSRGGTVDVHDSCTKDGDQYLKETLLRKYSGYLSSLKQGFSKRKKKGKLPKEARRILLDWWTAHYNWPYPTESDKMALAESTGLNQKQLNNWFINQRKRHWKPSESMQFALMDSLSAPFYSGD